MIKYKINYDIDIKDDIIDSIFDKMIEEKEGINKEKVGYYTLDETANKLINEIETYKKEIDLDKIKYIVIIGIGGSSLGIKAIDGLISHKLNSNIKLLFLENNDPINIDNSLKNVNKDNSLFLVISKSGSTLETISIFKYVIYRFNIDLKKDNKSIIVISEYDSALSKLALKYKIQKFNIPKNVGGRFSVLSAVGLVPLTIKGYDTKELLKGAKYLKERFFAKKERHIIKKAFFLTQNEKKRPINILFSYSSLFDSFNDWYVQLWGESLGKIDKNGKKRGLTPIGLIGSIDQHSFLQLIIQGQEDKTVTFLKIKDFQKNLKIPNISLDFLEKLDYVNNKTFNELINAQCKATMASIQEAKIPTDLITLDKLNEFNIGNLIYYFELLTSASGIILNINTYNQPGVELGKQKLIKIFS